MQFHNTSSRYGALAKFFHWTTAIAFISAYILVYIALWVYHDNKNPSFLPTLNVHWILGLLIGTLVIPRLIWKLLGVPVREPMGSPVEHIAARVAHGLLYAIMIVMPITGYLGTRHFTNFYVFQVPSFQDTALFHWISSTYNVAWKEFEAPLDAVHHFIGTWIAWVVVCLHVAAALFHHVVRRDDVLSRMMPGNRFRHDVPHGHGTDAPQSLNQTG